MKREKLLELLQSHTIIEVCAISGIPYPSMVARKYIVGYVHEDEDIRRRNDVQVAYYLYLRNQYHKYIDCDVYMTIPYETMEEGRLIDITPYEQAMRVRKTAFVRRRRIACKLLLTHTKFEVMSRWYASAIYSMNMLRGVCLEVQEMRSPALIEREKMQAAVYNSRTKYRHDLKSISAMSDSLLVDVISRLSIRTNPDLLCSCTNCDHRNTCFAYLSKNTIKSDYGYEGCVHYDGPKKIRKITNDAWLRLRKYYKKK